MLCQHCQKRIANVHFTQVVNNNKVEMYLCEQCAKEKGKLGIETPFSMGDFFSGMMGLANAANYLTSVPQQLVCENCGLTYGEFQKIGKMGCSNCYKVFGEKIQPLMRRLHGSGEHHGKVPKDVLKTQETSKEIEALKKLLNEAIKLEEYEKAAEIRDKLKNLGAGAAGQ